MTLLVRRLSLQGCLVAVSVGLATASNARQESDDSPNSRPAPLRSGTPETKEDGFRIVAPVVCRDVRGFEDFDELPDAELTSDEKLLVYYRPKGYTIVKRGDKFTAHFTQDGQVRARGRKKVLLRKAKLLDYEARSDAAPDQIYIRNTFSLKGLPPGEYEYDMILTDANAGAEAAPVTATVKFRIVAARLPDPEPKTRPRPRSRAQR